MRLNQLPPVPGSQQQPKRKGMGIGSGNGKTAGRGTKGQKARSGGKPGRGFEGGQMPLQRRLPKSGFQNIFKQYFALVKVGDLEVFDANAELGVDELRARGIIRRQEKQIKLLAGGELTRPVTIRVDRASQSAIAQVEAVGGKVIVSEDSNAQTDGQA
ncbi:MAG: 50S ribosomal protein L15 [Magnetococcales bacterium]|nr:50S ribosomal protein L15 [Magnetococcales bacterium]